jgi:hypothetical protein
MYFGLQQASTISPYVRLTGHMIKREEYFYIARTSLLYHMFEITTCIYNIHFKGSIQI